MATHKVRPDLGSDEGQESYLPRAKRSRMLDVLAVVAGIVIVAAIGSSHVLATPDVLRRATCPEGGRIRPLIRRLALTDNGNRIEVRLDVHGPRSQHVLWNVEIRHDGAPFLRRERFAVDGGDHSFQRSVWDRDGIDRFWARARIVANGPRGPCTVHASI